MDEAKSSKSDDLIEMLNAELEDLAANGKAHVHSGQSEEEDGP